MDKGIVVSCQAESDSAFNDVNSIVSFAKEATRGGAVGLRIRDVDNVQKVSHDIDLPIIGLTKSYYENGDVWITPDSNSAKQLFECGIEYVAMDATGRAGYEHIENTFSEANGLIIGDISHINQANNALKYGCEMLSTTLSGYTSNCDVDMSKPDFNLLKELIYNFSDVPIIAEGRYWEIEDVKKAFDMGANNVVIGTAITRPHLITKRYVEAYNG